MVNCSIWGMLSLRTLIVIYLPMFLRSTRCTTALSVNYNYWWRSGDSCLPLRKSTCSCGGTLKRWEMIRVRLDNWVWGGVCTRRACFLLLRTKMEIFLVGFDERWWVSGGLAFVCFIREINFSIVGDDQKRQNSINILINRWSNHIFLS